MTSFQVFLKVWRPKVIRLQSEENTLVENIYIYTLYINVHMYIHTCICTHILSLEELGFADGSCLSVLVAP